MIDDIRTILTTGRGVLAREALGLLGLCAVIVAALFLPALI